MIQIGALSFKTKSAAHDHFRAMIERHTDGQWLAGQDLAQMVDLVRERHPEGDQLLSNGFRGFIVRHNAEQYGNRNHLMAVYEDGYERSVSWSKCCRGFGNPTQWAKAAMRAAIWGQAKSFREMELERHPFCAETGHRLTSDTAEVDHYPLTFAALLGEFVARESLDLEQVDVAHVPNGSPRLVDRDLNSRWLDFHAKNAQLRIVTKQVNQRSWRDAGAIQTIA